VNNELERIWMKEIMAQFMVVFWDLPGKAEKSTKNLSG
jgi:hypothetical protein